ncbi:MAG: P-II family nitrogen regulator [Pseudomonadota bacterium]
MSERFEYTGQRLPAAARLDDGKLITAILPKGRSRALVEALAEKHGIHTATVHFARGSGRFSSIRRSALGTQLEKEIVDIVVPAERADEIFEYVFYEAEMNQPHSGIVWMAPAPKSTRFVVPELPAED